MSLSTLKKLAADPNEIKTRPPTNPATPAAALPSRLSWAPAMDVLEKEDKFVVKVELPGVKEEDINVSVAGDTLTIEGEKEAEAEVKKKGYYYSETSYGSFYRLITMPSTVDASKIEASYDRGVLEVTLPKAPEVKPKKISVAAKKKEEAASKKGGGRR